MRALLLRYATFRERGMGRRSAVKATWHALRELLTLWCATVHHRNSK